MRRFQNTPTPVVFTAMAFSMAAVFILDCFTPLGLAVWALYLAPIVLTYLTWHPWSPIAMAIMASLLTAIGYFVSPLGAEPALAQINRTIGIATVWILAVLGQQFIRNKLTVRKQEWLQSGQTSLSQTMLGEQDVMRLGDNVLRHLIGYLGAHAGAMFIEEGTGFRRCATHGISETARMPEYFEPGEGLLGQAVKDKRASVLHDLPQDYFSIGSSLGSSAPRHLIIAPLAADGRINTVLELGFFTPIGAADIELIERVAESIAVAVRSARYRSRLQDLLQETQRQAEELQVQSEELRVSNEELEEQSDALKKSHASLAQQQAELEQINMQLEEQAQVLEAQAKALNDANAGLETQARQLAQASKYKSEFLANMSHEMRTPLNSSLILAKLLADNPDGNLTTEQVKSLQTIETAGNDLLALIDDVLDLAKVEAGRLDLTPQAVSLERLMASLHALFLPQTERKKLQFSLCRSPNVPEYIETDRQRLEQILKNLLSNAIKFTEQGSVSLDISPSMDGRIAFSVRDTGIGIADDQQDMIFEPFCQADGTTNRKYGGTGLGLSISRQFACLLGGEIRLTSVIGEGSTFELLLPRTYSPPAAGPAGTLQANDPQDVSARATAPESLALAVSDHPAQEDRTVAIPDDRDRPVRGRRVILIVEDDEPFARLLSDLACELNFQTVIATTAAEAVALARRHGPSAVVLDLGLPDHSGLSVIDQLKTHPRTRHIPIHVISGQDHMHTALSLGAVGYLLKPVKREEIIEAFQRFEAQLAERPRRILIVEDDAAQRESLCRLVGSSDVETIGAATAAECLQQVAEKTFDCMILDVTLPDATAFSLLETLRQDERYAFPPVIVYTGRDLSIEEEQRLRKYSHSIIVKGAKSPERLLDEVTLFLHQVVSSLPPEQQAMLEKSQRRSAILEGRRILIVEDDVRNIFALSAVLEPHGATVDIARNGHECLAVLDRPLQAGQRAVDLILMDIMMPEMDGLAAMRAIRERAEWSTLPIIALTAKAMPQDQETALAAGANDYMAKPLNVDQLLSLVRVWMRR